MAERSSEPDGGCLSMLSSCLKKRGKARRDVPKSSQKEAVASKIPAALSSKPSPTSPATSPMPAPTGDDSRTPMSGSDGAPGELPPVAEAKPVNANLLPDEAPIEVNDTTTFSGLWFEAYKELSDDTRKWIDDKTKFADTKDPIQELADLVRTREEEYVNKTPTLKVGDREIIWRDYAERVVSWLITIGDISITFAPAPSPVVWSAVKTLLTTNVTQCNDLVAVLGCTDNVLGLVRRGRVYEGVYLEKSPLTAFQEKLKETLIETYKTCLEFLAYMNAKFKLSQVGQFIDVLLDPEQGKQRVSELKALESTLFQAAQSCGTENIQVETAKQTELLESLDKPLKRIDNKVEQVLDILEENERQKALDFVSTIRVGADHTTITDARTEKTCEWLIGNAEFREWEESSSSSLFWLQGRIGTGKSFLSSKVVDRYRVDENGSSQCLNHHDEAFAYFYCRRSDPDRQNIRPIVRSFVRQLGEVPRRPGKIHQALYKLVENSKSVQKIAGLDDYKHALVEMINTYPRTTLVLDALDECDLDTRAQLAEFLRELVEESTRLLKVFVASRKESDIECSFALFEDQQMLVEISTEDNKGDIEKFVDEKLIEVKRYWTFYDKDRMEKLAKDTLLEKSDAMFRWTYLQCERLKKCRTEDALKTKLEKLPETLSEAYDEIYNDPDREPSDLLMLQRAVRWVACARQPLDSCTLLSAMRAETEMVDGENALKRSDLTEMTLESVCRHLVVKDTGLGTWKCAHASVTEYFAEKGQPWFKDAEVEVAVVLINCLTDCCSNYPWDDPELEAKSTISAIERWFEWRKADPDNILDPRHPLQTYTHLNWLHHIHGIRDGHPRATDVACALKRFFGGNPHVCSKEYDTFRRTIMCGYWHYYAVMYNRMECNPHPEFGVIALGLHRVLDGWWDKELPSLMKSRGDDLLKTAIAFGHNDLCKRLVGQEGCSLNRDARSMYDSPIGTAIDFNNVGALKLILERGANPNRFFWCHSLLCEALRYGAEIIRILLANGANPDIRCNDGPASPHNCSFDCALSKAASNGKLDVLEALIEYGADVNPGNLQDEYGSPLTAAAANGKLDCALFLINHGAKVDPQLECGRFGSVLAAAAYSGSLETVQFLVQQHNVGVRTNLKVGDFGSSLTAAVTEGHVDCANFLIQHGADVNAYMEFGRYGSNMAAAILGPSSSLAMVKFLVENTDLNTTWRTVVQPRDKDERRQYMTYGTDVERIRIVMYLIRDLNIKAEMLISIGICPIAVEYGELDMESLVERLNEDLRAGRIDRK